MGLSIFRLSCVQQMALVTILSLLQSLLAHSAVSDTRDVVGVVRQNGARKNGNLLSALVLTETAGYRHLALEAAREWTLKVARNRKWKVEFSSDLRLPLQKSRYLRRYDVIVFMITTGSIFSKNEKDAFERYVNRGGAVVAVHSGMVTNVDWPFFRDLMGARFSGHARTQEARFVVTDAKHATVRGLPRSWMMEDEVYNLRKPLPLNDINVILGVDDRSFVGGKHPTFHPITWTKRHGNLQSRIWVTTLGHLSASFNGKGSAVWFQQHLAMGIEWAAMGGKQSRSM